VHSPVNFHCSSSWEAVACCLNMVLVALIFLKEVTFGPILEHHSNLVFSTASVLVDTHILSVLCKLLYCILRRLQVCTLSELVSHLYHQQMVLMLVCVLSLKNIFIYWHTRIPKRISTRRAPFEEHFEVFFEQNWKYVSSIS
jgi:hypothetical protein